jgi:pyruvate, orthophosphate dikinase
MAYAQFYTFGFGKADGDASLAPLLGSKGAFLAQMATDGYAVPPGATMTTEMCNDYFASEHKTHFLDTLWDMTLEPYMTKVVAELGHVTAFSCRSGGFYSMPGMMDTILNIGINRKTLNDFKSYLGERTALDSYRRGIQMFGATARGMDPAVFEEVLHSIRVKQGCITDGDLSVGSLEEICEAFEEMYRAHTSEPEFPAMREQILQSIAAVFDSWNSERAIYYREINGYPSDAGTGCTLQAMVFGNAQGFSGSGVAFSDSPNTGEDDVYGDFLENAQGEDVVAGIRDPISVHELPVVYLDQIAETLYALRAKAKDMVEIEFTIENEVLWILQTRVGKRTPEAAFVIGRGLVEDGTIDALTLQSRLSVAQFHAMTTPIGSNLEGNEIGKGVPAGGSLVRGNPCYSALQVQQSLDAGLIPIFIAEATSPDDLMAMNLASAVVTKTGGKTSHAAIVCRGLNTTCVVGVKAIDVANQTIGGWGSEIVVDGNTGSIYTGAVTITQGELSQAAKDVYLLLSEAVPQIPYFEVGASWPVKSLAVFNLASSIPSDIYDVETFVDWMDEIYNEFPKTPGQTIVIRATGHEHSLPAVDCAYYDMFGPCVRNNTSDLLVLIYNWLKQRELKLPIMAPQDAFNLVKPPAEYVTPVAENPTTIDLLVHVDSIDYVLFQGG